MSAITVQLYYDAAWRTVDAFEAEGWNYKIGPSLTGGIEASTLNVTLDNRSLDLDPSNPLGQLFRKIGRNTPARILINGSVAMSGEASSWKPTRTVDHTVSPARGRAQTELTAEGLLRRLGQWGDVLRSPMTRQIGSYSTLLGFWPMEDPANSQNFVNTVVGGKPGTFSGAATLDGDDGPGGALGAVRLSQEGRIAGEFKTSAVTNGYQISFTAKLDTIPSTGTYASMFQWYDSLGNIWYWRVNSGAYEVSCYDRDGNLRGAQAVAFGTVVNPSQWVRYRCKVTASGGTLTFEPAFQQQDGSIAGITGSFSVLVSITGIPTRWEVVANSYVSPGAYGMVFAITDTTIQLLNAYNAYAAFAGYLGETAGDRFDRLMTENGLNSNRRGTSSLSASMGRQKSASLVDLLTEIQQTDGGFIYDDPATFSGAPSLTFRQNNDILNQTPALALTYGVNVATPFDKIIDDQRLANDITGKNWDGTEVRVEDSTSYMSTQAPPLGVGRYATSLDVSFKFAAGVANRINWELRNNTLDRPRYQQLAVDLLANPSLLATVLALRPGDLVTVAGIEPQAVPLIVVNVERTGRQFPDRIVLNCLPGDLYETGKYDDGVHRYDSDTTTLTGALTSSTTSVPIFSADPMDKWSTTPGYGILLGPERCTVTACTAGSASGNGWAQTMTVTRGVNGVAIAHIVGESVNVYQPMRYSMKNVSNP